MLVLGDAHTSDPDRREAFLDHYRRLEPDAVLQVGDLECYELPAPTWFIAGNNEDFDTVEALRAGETAGTRNVHLLASTLATVDGVRVAGLSGNYAPTKYDLPRDELSGERRRHFTHEDVEQAAELPDVDVLLVHEAPTGVLSYGYDPGCERVDELLAALSPELCLVGHHHRHREAEIEGTRVVSLAPAWERYYALDPETLALESHGIDSTE
ncbi:metallophosphoesterase family protein [Natronococcus occultus]|uniref:Putative phosphoesterase, ICC n=1 Tax=Natronococcus occultus SP4 TaxID=694430 RepID=L0K0V2_9EURY|nr:metallophosphoesterase family protein [Natronococcus occultus]AGB37748.1 putative phosphoesterase, ICC [Natronococcus occultus SP4]